MNRSKYPFIIIIAYRIPDFKGMGKKYSGCLKYEGKLSAYQR